jgi:hypothetical protein
MRKLAFAVAILFFTLLPIISTAEVAPSEYATLLAVLKGGNTNIDYGRLRVTYMESPEYKNAKDTTKEEKAMEVALGAKDYAGALKNAEAVLSNEYVNMDAQFVAYVANKETGATDQAEFHRAVFHGLVDSIFKSGDGKSPEKAWVVIKVHEEYVILRVLGYRPSEQALVNKDGHAYDEMTVKNQDDGTEAKFFFNVDIPMKHGL